MFYFNVFQKMEKTDFLGKVQHGAEKVHFSNCKVCVCVFSTVDSRLSRNSSLDPWHLEGGTVWVPVHM